MKDTYDMTKGEAQCALENAKHRARVNQLVHEFCASLTQSALLHDLSKDEEPELEAFAVATPILRETEYGTDKYRETLKSIKHAVKHHQELNPHHPEHYKNGIEGMDLIDLTEMLADWKAASERQPNGDLAKSIISCCERFGIPNQLRSILLNTAGRFGWSIRDVRLERLSDESESDDGKS